MTERRGKGRLNDVKYLYYLLDMEIEVPLELEVRAIKVLFNQEA